MKCNFDFDRRSGSTIAEPECNTRIYDEVDVIVVGGGPAGVGAALAAARSGATTLLVERYGCFGGIWTAGLLNPYFDASEKGGIPAEIIERLRQHNGSAAVHEWMSPKTVVFNYESMKYVLDNMVLESNIKPLLYTHAVASITDGSNIKGVVVENKSGRSAILGDVVIDCTGDGDVAYHAGCEYEFGRSSDNLTQPMTLEFKVRGFQWTLDQDSGPFRKVLAKYNSPDELAAIPWNGGVPVPVAGEPETVAMMWTHMHGLSGVDADDLTQGIIEGRRQVQKCMELLGSTREAVGDVVLSETAMQVGVRETRRVLGDYYLSVEDLLNGRRFDDGICKVNFPVDIHDPDGRGINTRIIDPYEIPYRCLLPKSVDQLLVAGRCISGSHEAHASYRVTGNCVAMGEAAGTAAATAVQEGVSPRKLDGRQIRLSLESNGAIF